MNLCYIYIYIYISRDRSCRGVHFKTILLKTDCEACNPMHLAGQFSHFSKIFTKGQRSHDSESLKATNTGNTLYINIS